MRLQLAAGASAKRAPAEAAPLPSPAHSAAPAANGRSAFRATAARAPAARPPLAGCPLPGAVAPAPYRQFPPRPVPSQLLLQLLHSHLCVPTRYSFYFTLGEDRRVGRRFSLIAPHEPVRATWHESRRVAAR